jgi:hypothetical protein
MKLVETLKGTRVMIDEMGTALIERHGVPVGFKQASRDLRDLNHLLTLAKMRPVN